MGGMSNYPLVEYIIVVDDYSRDRIYKVAYQGGVTLLLYNKNRDLSGAFETGFKLPQ